MTLTPLDLTLPAKVYATVQKYGKTVNFTIQGASKFDVAQGVTVQSDPTTFPIKVSPPANYAARLVDGDNILASDCYIILPNYKLTFTPARQGQVVIDDQSWTIQNISKIYSGELVAAYTLQLRI